MNKIKYLGLLSITFGIFLVCGIASASNTDQLQPASDVTYDENLVVNATGIFDSIKIGKQGVGGVTFFNGTIVNETTDPDTNAEIPVTFGDDVRIDGKIFRTEEGGQNHLKIADALVPTSSYNLGTASDRWDTLYADNVDLSSDLYVGGVLTGGGSVVVNDDLEVNQSLNVSSDANFSGNIYQNRGQGGAAKALVYINSDGTCGRSWTYSGSSVDCYKNGTGQYRVDFKFNVHDRYIQATPQSSSGNRYVTVWETGYVNSDNVAIYVKDDDGLNQDSSLWITVF